MKPERERAAPSALTIRRATFGLWIALAILAGIALLRYGTMRTLVATTESVDHTHGVMDALGDLRWAMTDALSLQRAHALTGDDGVLEGYGSATRSVRAESARLRTLTADNPRQQHRSDELEPLLTKYVATLDAAIESRRRRSGTPEQAVRRTIDETAVPSAVSSLLREMEAEERQLLSMREARTAESVSRANAVVVFGTLASFAILVFGFTQLRRALQELGRRSEELDQFFDVSRDLLCISGLDGYFKRLNQRWTEILGWTHEELMSKAWLELVHDDDRAMTIEAMSELKVGRAVEALTNRYRCKDGTYRWLEWRAAPSIERGITHAAARDNTERRRAEETEEKTRKQLVLAERLVSVGTLAAGVAHEINNPLTYVAANLDMIVDEIHTLSGGSPSGRMREIEEMALEALQGAERIKKIVRGMKTFSRADEEERRAVVDVRPVLELSINIAFNEIRHRARLVKDYGATPLIEADDARLGQVFVNLLVNAAQAIPEGDVEANEIRIVTSTDAAGRAVVEVRDTGPGIPPSALGRIFDPFFTTKPVGVGTGLGLAICHNIVTGMGGEVSVTSELGRGTTFRVVLAAASVQEIRPVLEPATMAAAGRQASILIVDDDEAVGASLGRLLREHRITLVTKASEALERLASIQFDIILSDLMMPEMSGMDFFEELSKRDPNAAKRVIFVTGGAFTPAAEAFLARIKNDVIEKPIDPRTMRALVNKLLQPSR
jgi:PAS domain S-box-containing protein